MSLIEVSNVYYAYADGCVALRDVSIKIERGERVAVLGPNGAGKSTLFALLNGLLQVSSGSVYVDGLMVEKNNLFKIRSKVGMLFQDSDDQLFNSTVRQEVAYGLRNMRIAGEDLEDTINWALEAVGISGYGDKSPHNLSGGEKKRVALASVLAMKPEVLVLDEPTSGLDPQGVSSLVKLLNEINKNMGITLVFSSHDADIIPLLADRIYLMNAGSMVNSGGTGEVFAQKDLIRKTGLRLPRVAHLLEILDKYDCLHTGQLPLTIGQARRVLGEACRAAELNEKKYEADGHLMTQQADHTPSRDPDYLQNSPLGHGHPKRADKLGILLAAFGTAIAEAREGYRQFEQMVRDRYPGVPVAWAYTAHKVRRKLAEKGLAHDSLAVALSRLHDQGVTNLAVQSLHSVPGVEYHWTQAQAQAFHHPRKGFRELSVGTSLLHDEDDLRSALAAFPGLIPFERKADEAVVLVGHGTYHQAQQRYLDYERLVKEQDKMVFMGTLMGRPGLEDILEALRQARVSKAWLVPFMCVAGYHVREEIFGPGPDSWQSTLERAGIVCKTRMVGTIESSGMADIWLTHLDRAVEKVTPKTD